MSRWRYSSIQPSSGYFGRHDLSHSEAHSNSRLAASPTNDRPSTALARFPPSVLHVSDTWQRSRASSRAARRNTTSGLKSADSMVATFCLFAALNWLAVWRIGVALPVVGGDLAGVLLSVSVPGDTFTSRKLGIAFVRVARTVSFHSFHAIRWGSTPLPADSGSQEGHGRHVRYEYNAFNLNVPLPAGTDDALLLLLAAFWKALFGLVRAYDPDAVAMCVGADDLAAWRATPSLAEGAASAEWMEAEEMGGGRTRGLWRVRPGQDSPDAPTVHRGGMRGEPAGHVCRGAAGGRAWSRPLGQVRPNVRAGFGEEAAGDTGGPVGECRGLAGGEEGGDETCGPTGGDGCLVHREEEERQGWGCWWIYGCRGRPVRGAKEKAGKEEGRKAI
ncbi:hypothetical protein THAOC_04114 [Thalassiosira oceanica]|uniref:Uncharacterized protein n=1 Tax=Thalassiosira oceanica TaxID=159749 RepID=K0T9Q4_THAOC|nr:hypothetical protein THAOC_04114 [Thalassiosira oceanica]|eukprot:EJK74220.1 hypothetical protein THAOC_04114 [Thalassiosira oceanica]